MDDESALSDKQKMVGIRRIAAVGKFKDHFDLKNPNKNSAHSF